MQLISPRQQQAWAASYQQRAARLEAEGRMQPSGRAILERARAAGTVDAMSDVDALVVPQDLQDCLDRAIGRCLVDPSCPVLSSEHFALDCQCQEA